MVRKKTKKNILLIIISLLILITVGIIGQQLTTFTSSEVRFEDGTQAWVVDATITNRDTTPAKVIFRKNDLADVTTNKLTPQFDETVEIKLLEADCVYNVVPTTQILGGNGLYKVTDPDVTAVFEARTFTKPSVSTIHFSQDQPTAILNENNAGILTAQVTGGELANYCYNPGEITVLKLGDSVTILDFDKIISVIGSSASPGTILQCFLFGSCSGPSLKDNTYDLLMTNTRFDGTTFIATPRPDQKLGRFDIRLTADKEYFEAMPLLSLDPTGVPNIKSVECPDLVSGQKGTTLVVVENKGSSAGISITLSSDDVSFTQNTQTKFIIEDEQKTYPFVLLPTEVTGDVNYKLTVLANSQAQIGQGATDVASCTGKLSEAGLLPKPVDYCGDNECSFTENPLNCPEDCRVTQCNANAFEILNPDTRKCQCINGYERDEEGNCVEEQDFSLIISAVILGVFIITSIIIVRMNTNNRRINRNRKR